MQISIKQILEMLKGISYQTTEGIDLNHNFARVMFLIDNMDDLQSDSLYITDSETLLFNIKYRKSDSLKDIYFVCMYKTPDSFDQFSNLKCSRFREYYQWGCHLDNIIASDGGLQQMVDASERFFSGPIIAWDSSFDIVAYSKTINHANSELDRYCKLGHLPPLTVENLLAQNLLSFSTTSGIRYVPKEKTIPGADVYCFQYLRDGFRLYAIAYYAVKPNCSDAELERLQYFFNKCESYLSTNLSNVVRHGNAIDVFLQDLIAGKYVDVNEIRAKAAVFHVDINVRFVLYCISFDDIMDTKYRYISDYLQKMVTNARVFRYEDRIIMLRPASRHAFVSSEKEAAFKRLMKNYHASCGVSPSFTDIKRIKYAYRLADDAIRIGKLLQIDKGPIYLFKDYMPYALIRAYSTFTDIDMIYMKKLDILIEEDQARGTNNLELISTYLSTNNSVSLTAQKTNFHRNSVLYRLKRIEKVLGISLENPDEVLRLRLSLMILQYNTSTRNNIDSQMA